MSLVILSKIIERLNILKDDSHSLCSFQGVVPEAIASREPHSNKFCGGLSEREIPVPIPNTEVKPLCADDTARATLWESKSPPHSLFLSRTV